MEGGYHIYVIIDKSPFALSEMNSYIRVGLGTMMHEIVDYKIVWRGNEWAVIRVTSGGLESGTEVTIEGPNAKKPRFLT